MANKIAELEHRLKMAEDLLVEVSGCLIEMDADEESIYSEIQEFLYGGDSE